MTARNCLLSLTTSIWCAIPGRVADVLKIVEEELMAHANNSWGFESLGTHSSHRVCWRIWEAEHEVLFPAAVKDTQACWLILLMRASTRANF